jgi:glycerol-3-phosphate dehydrogenase subunit C
LEFNPATPTFWDPDLLEQDSLRTFDICSQCRQCKDICPTFEYLFYTIDNKPAGGPRGLFPGELAQAVDLCYLCRNCYSKCPYKSPHEHGIDIPHLVMRSRAVPSRSVGISFQNRLLGNSDYTGKLGCALYPLSNYLINNRLWRIILEKTAGIDREYGLKRFNRPTFSKWSKRKSRKEAGKAGKGDTNPKRKVALFAGCALNYHGRRVGEAIIDVLRHNDTEVALIDALSCGHAHLEAGDMDAAVGCARENTILLKKYLDDGFSLVIAEPSCYITIKYDYPGLLYGENGLDLSENIISFVNYIHLLEKNNEFKTDFKLDAGKVMYQNLYYQEYTEGVNPGMEVLKRLPGSSVKIIEGTTIGGGIWGMRRKYRSLRLKRFDALFKEISDYRPDYIVTDSFGTGLQPDPVKGPKVLHLAEILKKGYGI